MASPKSVQVGRRRLQPARLADVIAAELRRQIVAGELSDGDLLPPQAALVEMFDVSLVSVREALRILEAEGLVSVQRGNRGGAVVHAPAKAGAAYALGLLLESDRVRLNDLGVAVQHLEAVCAVLCARRPDRAAHVIPDLKVLTDAAAEAIGDGPAFTELGRQFHDLLVRRSGNHTVAAVVGTLETLWTSHEQQWAQQRSETGDYPSEAQQHQVLDAHRTLTTAIEAGDSLRTQIIAASHLGQAQSCVLNGDARQRIIAMSAQSYRRRELQ